MKLIDALDHQPTALTFGTSGLRGLLTDMTDLECFINVAGFIEFLKRHDNLRVGQTVYLAGDLRDSTPHIMDVAADAIQQAGLKVVNCGKIPTPALAYYAQLKQAPGIMVTGSHIPADRNGIKFYKRAGEVLKEDEAAINEAVTEVRQALYGQAAEESEFNAQSRLKRQLEPLPAEAEAEEVYLKRYTDFFAADSFAGKQIVVYLQSAVGRDLLVELFKALGAEVVPVERLDSFLPIDTENVTPDDKQRFKRFSLENPGAFAIISTDGDSDRPFVIDEAGEFHRGDVLGAVVARYLQAGFAAVPISANDAVNEICRQHDIELVHTKIGSPYVIAAMQSSAARPTVSWEVNGGFLLGSDIERGGKKLLALPTRDAVLPIICSLLAALDKQLPVSGLFAELPRRFTGGGLIDDVPTDQIARFRSLSGDRTAMQKLAQDVFSGSDLGGVASIDITDGLRLIFDSGEVIHLRPSGNAPQFRVYTNADTQQGADELAANATAPDGYIIRLLDHLSEVTK